MKEKANETRKIRSKEMRMINREYDEIVFDSKNAGNREDQNSSAKQKGSRNPGRKPESDY